MGIAYPFRNYIFLYGASAKSEVINCISTECVPEEQDSLPKVVSDWVEASKAFREIEQRERGEAEAVEVNDIPQEYASKIASLEENILFKQSFSLLPYEFKLVEIDRLVASQRAVNLDYVDILKGRVPAKPSMSDLIETCLSPQTIVKPPAEQILAPNVYSYTSESVDFRFLGGFSKPLSKDDLEACKAGGFPLAAVVLLVGLGAGSMNVLSYGGRVVLNNGFHRAYALRSMGVTHIPVIVQKIANPQLEFPPAVANLPREYLLGAVRPALIKDFFNPALVRNLRFKARNRVVQVQWGANQFSLPIVG